MRSVASLAVLLVATSLGCSKPIGPDLRLRVAARFDKVPDGSCQLRAFSSLLGAATVRLTARVAGADPNTPADLCDAMIRVADFGTPQGAVAGFRFAPGAKVDLFAEVFGTPDPMDPTKETRVASGALFNVATLDAKMPLDLRLVETETFRCVDTGGGSQPARLAQARAFHTATTLPNGQIFFAGGVIPAPDGSVGPTGVGNSLFLTGRVEIFDPTANTFFEVAENKPPARGFHQAFLLANDVAGRYRVLLVGGVAPMQPGMPVLKDTTGESYGFRLVPHQANVAPAELLTYDPVARTLVRSNIKAAMFPSAAFAGGAALRCADGTAACGALVAGGVSGQAVSSLSYEKTVAATRDSESAISAPIEARYGASVTLLSDKVALLYGGQTAIDQKPFVRIGVDAQLSATELEKPVNLDFPVLQFPTVTLLDPGAAAPRLLVSGGLVKSSDMLPAIQPPEVNGGLWRITAAAGAALPVEPVLAGNGYKYDVNCNEMLRYRPVAFNAATLLPSGDRVLLTGGTPRFINMGCNDCEGGEGGLSCALSRAAIYTLGDNSITPVPRGADGAPEMLQLPRFGHTQSLLPDRTVLIVGGLTRRGGNTFGVREAELWNPARRTPPATMDRSGSTIDPDDPVAAQLVALGRSRRAGKAMFTNGDGTERAAFECQKAKK